MTRTDRLVKTMRQQAKTYLTATCDYTALESEWIKIVAKHNNFIQEKGLRSVYEPVDDTRFDDLFKYLSKEWDCDCKCEHLNQDSDVDTYWDEIRETHSCETLIEEIRKGQCKCDFITGKLQDADEGTRALIETLRERLVSHGASIQPHS